MTNQTLSTELLSVPVCPHDHGKLTHDAVHSKLTCQKCGHVYPVERGVPNMLK